MPQFFVTPETLQHSPVILRGADARHVTTVLRLGVGDWLVLCDGTGHRYTAQISALRPLHVEVVIRQPLLTQAVDARITLAAAIIRPERFKWLIEKAFELGCRRLVPLTTQRTVAKYLPKRPTEKLARWRAIALAAAKQSGLPWLPEVTPPTPLANILHTHKGAIYYCWEGLALNEEKRVTLPQPCTGDRERVPLSQPHTGDLERVASDGGSPWPPAASAMPVHGGGRRQDPPPLSHSSPLILIGPEGGFSADEHTTIMQQHPRLLPLGPLILRSETAAVAALILLLREKGYFDRIAIR